MNRRAAALLAVAVLAVALAFPSSAGAAACALDNPPAATLLLPYFEVDLGHPSGLTTLFSINNASATAILANVTLWTDLGIPTLSFTVYLTGYDIQTINIRDLLAGQLPQTATDGQDHADTISPQGQFSQDVNFASCNGLLPPQAVTGIALADLQAAHTGGPGSARECLSQIFGDGRARGFITIDTVSSCSTTVRSPRDAGYFGIGSTGRATAQNVLWGDFFLVDPDNNFAEGENLVRIEALPGRFAGGSLTFYGRFVGYSAADEREPLATVWATRFVNGAGFDGGTHLVTWRDPEGPSTPWNCGGLRPEPWYPLPSEDVVIFDEQENPELPFVCPFTCPPNSRPSPFPAVANRVTIGRTSTGMPVPFDFGWLYFNLGDPSGDTSPNRSQAFVVTLMSASGRYAVGLAATPFDTACDPHPCPPGSGPCPP